MRRALKTLSLIWIPFVYLLAACAYPFLAAATGKAATNGFERLASNRWLVLALLTLIFVALAEMILRSPESRTRRQIYWGGVFSGVGISVCVAVDPGIGIALTCAGGWMAKFNQVKPTGSSS